MSRNVKQGGSGVQLCWGVWEDNRKLAVVIFKFGSVGAVSQRKIETTVNLSEKTFLLLFF